MNHASGNGHDRERDLLLAEHGVLIRETRQDTAELKTLLTNHIHEVLERFDRQRAVFTGALITLVFNLVGMIITLIVLFLRS